MPNAPVTSLVGDLLVLFQISTSGSLGHWIPRSPGSWASQTCLAGAKKERTERGRETPIPGGGGGVAAPIPFPFPLPALHSSRPLPC